VQGRAKLRIRPAAAALLAAFVAAGVPAAGTDEPDPPHVPLDRLLQLPPSAPVEARVDKRGGSTRGQWQARFEKAREELETARLALEAVRAELEEAAGGESWTMTAPGLGAAAAPDTPRDFKLSQDLRRCREELERSERQLQDLAVEANLAGVPEYWRQPDAPESDGAAPEPR
jgi:exonuclease VII small subunit